MGSNIAFFEHQISKELERNWRIYLGRLSLYLRALLKYLKLTSKSIPPIMMLFILRGNCKCGT